MNCLLGPDIKLLLSKIANDDEMSFREVFDYYKAPFYATALKMTRSPETAEEIVQEVFVAIWVKRKLISAAQKPEGYVYTILHNFIYSHFRKIAQEQRLQTTLRMDIEESENIVEFSLLEKEKKAIIEKSINQLPTQQKIIYKMAKQEGVSREEIARQLNISPNTVKNHLSAAVENLRNRLKNFNSISTWIFFWIHI